MPKYSLVYCKTPKDYVKMYKVARSCMSIRLGRTCQAGWDIWKEQKLWPTIWYHYLPNVTGVMLKKDRTYVARAFVFGKKTFFTRIYRKQGQGQWIHARVEGCRFIPGYYLEDYANKMRELFAAEGRKERTTKIKITKAFGVPAVMHKRVPHCPLPFPDMVQMPLYVWYDREAQEFVFEPKYKNGVLIIHDTYQYAHWLKSTQGTTVQSAGVSIN